MDVESPFSPGGIDNAGPALADLLMLAKNLAHDPIFLALVGCALIAWLVVAGPTLNKKDKPRRPRR